MSTDRRNAKQRASYRSLLSHTLGWTVLALALAIPLMISPQLRALDFLAFYCGGEAVAEHADPYHATPLGECEHRIATSPLFGTGLIIPVPLPPYTLAVVALLTRLPFAAAQHVFDLASLAALVVSLLLLRRITNRPALFIAFTLAPLAWANLALGQSVLIILGSIVCAAYLLHRGQDRCAAVAAAITMLDPHLGLPVCASLFLWRPKARLALLGLGSALAVISVVVVSLPVTLEYFSAVLPAHARSEAGAVVQCSLTALLVFLHVPTATALELGSLQYVVTVTVGLIAAVGVSSRLNHPSALVLLPPLFGILGGAYIHGNDFILAIPAALLLLKHLQNTALVTGSMIALAPLWKAVGGLPAPILTIIASVVLLLSVQRRAIVTLMVAAGLSLVVYLSTRVPAPRSISVANVSPVAYADVSWALHESAYPMSALDLAFKIPAWVGLLSLCLVAIRLALPHACTVAHTEEAQ